MKRVPHKSHLLLTLIITIILITIACAGKSINDLTCESIMDQTFELMVEEQEPFTEITDVQKLARSPSKLECKGIAETGTTETTPIVFYEEDIDGVRHYGFDSLPISHWGCDYLVRLAIETALEYGSEIRSIIGAETITDTDEKLQCAGTAIMGNGDRVVLEFYVESDITGEYGWYVSFYSGEQLEYHNNRLLYLRTVTGDTAQQLFDYLKGEGGVFDEDSYLDLQLRKEGGSFETRVVIKEGIDIESISPILAEMACALEREVFNGTSVDVVAVGGESLTGFDDIIRREICME